MEIKNYRPWLEISNTVDTVFFGTVQRIITPEEAERFEGVEVGIYLTGIKLNFLSDGRIKREQINGVFPYEICQVDPDNVRVGAKARLYISASTVGGTTENAYFVGNSFVKFEFVKETSDKLD